MAGASAIGFVVPRLDPHNAGTNAAGGEGNDVGYMAVVEVHVARAAESKGKDIGDAPLLERLLWMQWRACRGSRATKRLESAQGWTFIECLLSRGVDYQSKVSISPFCLCIHDPLVAFVWSTRVWDSHYPCQFDVMRLPSGFYFKICTSL
jgi:hypothetical protein